MNEENTKDEMPQPIQMPEKEPPRALRALLIFLAVGLLAGGVLLQNRMFRNRNQDENRETPTSVKLTPPPAEAYPWTKDYDPANSIVARIPEPTGLVRVATEPESFGNWLRFLPLKPGRPDVMLHTGQPKHNQNAHFAVLDIDTGQRDLQQCADAVIRLRAEYLRSAGLEDKIQFNFTSGDNCCWDKWVGGERPTVEGSKVTWNSLATTSDRSYENFRKYLDTVFTYAGTQSLAKELVPVNDFWDIRVGDVFIHPGSPGHAVIVVDVVEYPKTGRRGFMLAQSFMPAQDMHILVNPADSKAEPLVSRAGANRRKPEFTNTRMDIQLRRTQEIPKPG